MDRIGRVILMSRCEAADKIPIEFESYEMSFKDQCCKPVSKLTGGTFQQMAKFEFGTLKILIRTEADCAEDLRSCIVAYDEAEKEAAKLPPEPEISEAKKLDHSDIKFLPYGDPKKSHSLMLCTTYPQGKEFPFFTWAQLFFSGNLLIN